MCGALLLRGKTPVKLAVAAGVVLLAAVMLPHAALSSDDALQPGDILLQFQSPGSSPCDLAWDGTHLWLADDGTGMIYKLDPADGGVLASFTAPGLEPRGLVWDGKQLWHTDNAARKFYTLDRSTGATQTSMDVKVAQTSQRLPELGGLTWDGHHLWQGMVNGWSSRMNQVDPRDGSITRSVFTMGYPRALATDGTFIWNATDNDGRRLGIIYKYKLSDGLFVSQFDTPGFYPSGLAFDGQCLWCVDRATKTVYKLAAN
jgi:streptogramin lyase